MSTAHDLQLLQSSRDSFLSWETRDSKTQISTDNVFSLTNPKGAGENLTLDGILRSIQSLGVPRCPSEEITYLDNIGEGGTFNVAKCQYHGKIVAVKYIKLGEHIDARRFNSLNARLRSVLQEVCIMLHEPLANHPTILSLVGYGWDSSVGAPLPYIVVEHGDFGSLRSWLRSQSQKGLGWLRSKIILAGDVAAGLMALHQCEIVHGDLKLDNVIVFGDQLGRPFHAVAKIADFGHSILTSPEAYGTKNYYGTSLYNAPEVFMQETSPIEPKEMHKCDIWAFALLVWEILADGAWYFKYSWRLDPRYACISSTTSNDSSPLVQDVPGLSNHSGNKPLFEPENSYVFGNFDVRHLRVLAKTFVNASCGTGAEFEKSFLRPFFERTLQIEACNRPSNLANLPIMRHWNQSGTARLQTKLAMHLRSSKLAFDMFRIYDGKEIPWSEQRGMLEDIQRIANWQEGGVPSSIAAYQMALCYLYGFGTTTDTAQASSYLRLAAGMSHPLALLFNTRILSAMGGKPMGGQETYASLLSQALRHEIDSVPNQIKNLKLQCFASSTPVYETTYLLPLSPAELLPTLATLVQTHEWPASVDLRVHLNGGEAVLTMIEAVILSGDDNSASWLLSRLPFSTLEDLDSTGEPAMIRACKAGKARTVCTMIEMGADPCIRSTTDCTLLHWLFCIEDDLAMVEEALQPWQDALKNVLDLRCTEVFTIHQQWPLRLLGSPLAFATLAGSQAAVETLLKLGASPTADAFSGNPEVELDDWSPLHIAIKNRLPLICRAMLERIDLPIAGPSLDRCMKAGFVSALSFSSIVEQYCIHGEKYAEALDETILCLPKAWLSMASTDGRTPLTQAIEFGDVETVRRLLHFYPELAFTARIDPEDSKEFDYPIFFACLIAGQRDLPGMMSLYDAFAAVDVDSLNRQDSGGRTCLHIAAAGVSDLLVETLLKDGASALSIDHDGRTALFYANNLPIFSRLLHQTEDTAICDRSGVSIGHYAVLNDRLDILEELIRLKAPLCLVYPEFGTPLHCAIQKGLTRHVAALLEAGFFDATEYDPGFQKLLKLTITSGNPDIVRDVMSHGFWISTSFLLENFEMLEYVLADPRNLLLRRLVTDFRNQGMAVEERELLLHYLARRGDQHSMALLAMLIDKAALDDVWRRQCETILSCVASDTYRVQESDLGYTTFQMARNQTPVHTAARFCNCEALKLYGRVSFSANVKDENGNTPLQLAMQQSAPGYFQFHAVHGALTDAIVVLLSHMDRSVDYAEYRAASISWPSAQAQGDFCTLTFLVMYCNFPPHGLGRASVKFMESVPDKIDWSLLAEAIRRNEVGFVASCLRARKLSIDDDPPYLWLTPVNMLKLYHYAEQLDFHMLRWRFNQEDDPDADPDDNPADYTKAGGETRNYCYEWCMLRLGAYYQGHRADDEFDEARGRLQVFADGGNLVWAGRTITGAAVVEAGVEAPAELDGVESEV